MRRETIGQNSGLMGGTVVLDDGQYNLEECNAQGSARECKIRTRFGLCGEVLNGVKLKGKLHCGKPLRARIISPRIISPSKP